TAKKTKAGPGKKEKVEKEPRIEAGTEAVKESVTEIKEEKKVKSGIRIIKKAEPKKEAAPVKPETGKKPEAREPAPGPAPAIEIIEKGKKFGKDIKKPKPIFIRKARKGEKKPIVEIIEKGKVFASRGEKVFKKGKVKPRIGERIIAGPKKPVARKTPQKIKVHLPVNVRTLALRINVKPNDIIQYLMKEGAFININQDLEEDVVRDIMENFGYKLEIPRTIESMEKDLIAEHYEVEQRQSEQEAKAEIKTRAPVVTFMGHVDHGKTSLLDYIRKTMVTKGEKGGITQHIGAYKVDTAKGSVTFLDTPGHAAFTAMRARGAHVTDVVVLVVAADDGVMPQTKEAIDHARAAEVPIVVAINKCDLPNANPERVRKSLQQEDLIAEAWGGKTVMVEVSAHTGEGVDALVEMLMLESEMLELKANPGLRARGVVIESKKTPGQGVVATLLVKNGTLRAGDIVFCRTFYGKLKAMMNVRGDRVEEAPPATPVEVLGLQDVPQAGEEFFVVKDEKKARTLALLKQSESRKEKMAGSQRVTLEDLHSRIVDGSMKELKIILKADVQGSVEALQSSIEELATEEVKLKMIHSAVGNINESDVMLAMVSNAVVIGFHVKIDTKAEELTKSEKVDYHIYDIIYEAIADVKAGMEGLLEPEEREVFQGSAQVREVFSTSKAGKVAGCAVTKGVIHRKDKIKVKRGQEVVFQGEINSLKRFKDDVKDVREGFECGISLKGFNNIRRNDVIEAFIIEKVARRLEK
ncbi:MAG: translation initiation factor IF-2, partial [Candidatus Omnitrophota bacterium]|nr:translation initiation factor IF-2 [Candidatus Omnitrophota bacterium]